MLSSVTMHRKTTVLPLQNCTKQENKQNSVFGYFIKVPWPICSSLEPVHYRAHTKEHKNQPAMFHLAFSLRPKTGMFLVLTALLQASMYSGADKHKKGYYWYLDMMFKKNNIKCIHPKFSEKTEIQRVFQFAYLTNI